MQTDKSRQRKRGVRASRAKLNAALIKAGLRTQSALAERIADQEALDSVPRDLVNRVFRERPVEPKSLERVARGLGVEAYSLYLTRADEHTQERVPNAADTPPHGAMTEPSTARNPRAFKPSLWVSGIAIGLLVLTLVWWVLPSHTPLGCRVNEFFHPVRAAEGKLGIVIARFEKDSNDLGQHMLAMNFLNDARLDPYVSILNTCWTLSLDRPGDVGSRQRAVRAQARAKLHSASALLLLWGKLQGDRIDVRFVSTRAGTQPGMPEIADGSTPVREARVHIPVSVNNPSDAMRRVKTTALRLMHPAKPAQEKLRSRVMRTYNASLDGTYTGPQP